MSEIDLVIVNYNTKSMLFQCLQSIAAHTSIPHEIIVVDNGSTDGSVQALRHVNSDHLIVIANNHNKGYAKACNQGIVAGSSPYILLLNSDVMVTEQWLEPLLHCMKSDPRIAVVGPKMIDEHGRITGAGVVGTEAHHVPRGLLERDEPGKYDQQEDCLSVCGAAYLIRRDLLGELGLFDEHYFFYFEETDYSFHARHQGYRVVYCPQSTIYHLMGQSCNDHGKLRSMFEESERYFKKKWAHVMHDSQ
ncbi:glycosyltransferase family 2 protein [Sulfoacidibacillus ferrooxidans]|uniref:Poly-beta-1,6-N-acetyl-D-glucosamine synthase n=1 Tax=Sulfoacidibacillus ferrooxidans TaxID=2005001 RepID=A0A9X1VB37_9BACL|nr:glycosyltransferase family 2 protein [Sulfoacidibacillus ferrooxidans]MCI0184442.1 Poly-beta-1,6-N-acetyl-D-glucosamine synthase [Sulfoacidibacillus ferrooxidans]